MSIDDIRISREDVFKKRSRNQDLHPSYGSPELISDEKLHMELADWTYPVMYFVGRNGSGKSRTAKAIARKVKNSLYLSTDRLLGLMNTTASPHGSFVEAYEGLPLKEGEGDYYLNRSRLEGMASDQLKALREEPEVGLRVAAFVRKVLGRTVEMTEDSGFFDPQVFIGEEKYSLLRDEGHGLREIVILLAAVYRKEWQLLIVDEPELHLHPSMARLWVAELNRECERTQRNAIVITHEPSLVRPTKTHELNAIWLFDVAAKPVRIGEGINSYEEKQVDGSLRQNPQLVSHLMFAPRPVLVEGPNDLLALSSAISRTKEPEVVAQTEFVYCGSSHNVAFWFFRAKSWGLDVKAVGDLDSLFTQRVQRSMDMVGDVSERYENELYAVPAETHAVVREFRNQANSLGIGNDEKSLAKWLAELSGDNALVARRNKVLAIWRDEGFWLHPEGTIEDVLGGKKGSLDYSQAASAPGLIDNVVEWCAFRLDATGELYILLQLELERIANEINHATGRNPGSIIERPVGPRAEIYSRLVDVQHISDDRYRLIVKLPDDFAGYFMEFDRGTSVRDMIVSKPQ